MKGFKVGDILTRENDEYEVISLYKNNSLKEIVRTSTNSIITFKDEIDYRYSYRLKKDGGERQYKAWVSNGWTITRSAKEFFNELIDEYYKEV